MGCCGSTSTTLNQVLLLYNSCFLKGVDRDVRPWLELAEELAKLNLEHQGISIPQVDPSLRNLFGSNLMNLTTNPNSVHLCALDRCDGRPELGEVIGA